MGKLRVRLQILAWIREYTGLVPSFFFCSFFTVPTCKFGLELAHVRYCSDLLLVVTLQHLRFVVMNFADLFPLVYDGSLNLDVVMRIWPNLSDSDDSVV